MDNSLTWKIIDTYFHDNPECLVSHHLESYNDFFKNGIFKIFKENNPIRISSNYDEKRKIHKRECLMYFGGKDGKKIYFGKPIIYDEDNVHYMFPNEARLRNMTYAMTIHYDIDIEYINILEEGEDPEIVMEENIIGGGLSAEQEAEIDYLPEYVFKNLKKNNGISFSDNSEEKRQKDIQEIKKINKKHLTTAGASQLRNKIEKSMVGGNKQIHTITLEKIYLGKFPIMLHSDFCILKGLPPDVLHTMGECKSDLGGYFIIQGLEKTVITQEKFADNMLYIREINDEETLCSAEIRSVSTNASKPIRTLSVNILSPTNKYTNKNIVVNIPNVRKPVPLFIVFRALGILTDKEIISTCLLDLDKYEQMIDLFIPSIHDTGGILTQKLALEYIASFTKGKKIEHALEILSDYFLPHIGETNFNEKSYFLGNMVFRLLSVYIGLEKPIDRDNFKYKRLELTGSLIYELFMEYYNIQIKKYQVDFEEKIFYNKIVYENNLPDLVQTYYKEIFKNKIVETGFNKAFKGNWGAKSHTKRVGVVQDINRLSFNSYLSHLRKTNLPLDSSVKLVGPRVLHGSQWGFIDPIDTPDGGNIGLHKTLAISTLVTKGGNMLREPFISWMRENISLKFVSECSHKMLAFMTKVFINGYWAGSILDPFDCVKKIKLFRRNALLPIFISVSFDIKLNTIFICTDDGRLTRPIFYVDEETGKFSFENGKKKEILEKIENNDFSWNELTTGFNKKKIKDFNSKDYKIYELGDLYENVHDEKNPSKIERFLSKKAIIDYIDNNESETALIALNAEDYETNKNKKFTHIEIHESLIFGTMCNLIIFPENNPPTRNSFSCGQSKQACSMYHTNYQVRMDKTGVVLNNGQIPLVKSRYMEHINGERNPYGENAIVAIMCYTGYNVEDAVLINEGSLQRGLFNTTYYNTYHAHEETNKTYDSVSISKFSNIEEEDTVVGTKPGFDYSKLDKYGLIKEGTEVNDKTVLIGLVNSIDDAKKIDASVMPKKGQLGIVDKTFITESEEGQRIAKVRIREQRIPNLGDKMASRSGQKGTVGLIIPEKDMPFTRNGVRPDIIINPHAIPSRMTIGQLVECVIGKACLELGGYGDCTAFANKGSKVGIFGEILSKFNYHSSGNELLYNGMNGEQIESEIYIGPTYYMRLKHMVKDKINYRALGPRSTLTRQTVSGRANDGGLRIGEMERDSVISHGISNFLSESMMERGDQYYMAVCNKTGLLAIYNPSKNVFFSPMADGPVKFVSSIEGDEMNIENITKFGRDFSIIKVPYSFKLLIQELQAINIQLRIITEDNIEQLESLSYSNNIGNIIKNSDPSALKTILKNALNDIYSRTGQTIPKDYKESDKPFEPMQISPPYPPSPPYGDLSPEIETTDTDATNSFSINYSLSKNKPYLLNKNTKESVWLYDKNFPTNWKIKYSEDKKSTYWVNSQTKETLWTTKMTAPTGWKIMYSQKNYNLYWFDEISNKIINITEPKSNDKPEVDMTDSFSINYSLSKNKPYLLNKNTKESVWLYDKNFPTNWKIKYSEDKKSTYWVNSQTKETLWTTKMTAPTGWKIMYSQKNYNLYWFDEISNKIINITEPKSNDKNENTNGGGFSNKDEYELGEFVHYRGDLSPNTFWKITKIGNNFITIRKQKLTPKGDFFDENEVKVAQKQDIYRHPEIQHTELIETYEPQEPPLYIETNTEENTNSNNYDNMVDTVDTVDAIDMIDQPLNPTKQPTINFAPIIHIGNKENIIQQKEDENENPESSNEEPSTENETTESNFSNENNKKIDFNKVLIKKV